MRIVFVHEQDENCSAWRIEIPGRALVRRGHQILDYHMFNDPWPIDKFAEADIVVAQRITTERHLENFRTLKRLGVPTLVELDDDFRPGVIQPDNPAYKIYHPNMISLTPKEAAQHKLGLLTIPKDFKNQRREFLLRAVREADGVTTTTPVLADVYRAFNPRSYILPNCWDDHNPAWRPERLRLERPPESLDEIWLLFSGSLTHISDMKEIGGAVREILRAYPQTRLVIGGDRSLNAKSVGHGRWEQVSTLLAENPKDPGLSQSNPNDQVWVDGPQYRFLGSKPFESYPELISQGDIILAPLDDIQFNQSKSDIRLLEAAIIGVPWVGSDLSAYRAWNVGGLLVRKKKHWYRSIEQLVLMSPEERVALASEARAKADSRSISNQIPNWEAVYQETIDRVARERPRLIPR